MNDSTTIRTAVRSLLMRQVDAVDNFIAYVVEQIGCTEEEAAGVFNLYRKERLVKVDSYMGTWHIKHGALLDADVLRRAVTQAVRR